MTLPIVEARAVTGGVDTHAGVHVAAALDPVGGLLGVREFPATPAGYASLLGWLGGFGTVCLAGIEGTGSYGAGLARHITAAGVRVVEVDRSDRQDRRRQRVCRIASTVARLAGLPDPPAHAEKVAAAFLPDVVRYQPGVPAVFEPGGGNGRALGDDSFDIAVEFLAGARLGHASTPRAATPKFPYLSASQPADLPALADLFGLRGQHSDQTSSTGTHIPEPASRANPT